MIVEPPQDKSFSLDCLRFIAIVKSAETFYYLTQKSLFQMFLYQEHIFNGAIFLILLT